MQVYSQTCAAARQGTSRLIPTGLNKHLQFNPRHFLDSLHTSDGVELYRLQPNASGLCNATTQCRTISMLRQSKPHLRTVCYSAATFAQDPADVIPDAAGDSDDEDDGKPAEIPVVVVGAGAIGLLASMYLARRGYTVQVMEKQGPPSSRPQHNNEPLVLSARALMAFQELGAKDLLDTLTKQTVKGKWRVSSPASPPHLDQYPGPNAKYTRRVVVGSLQLEQLLLEQAQKLYPDKITVLYHWEFKSVDWDRKLVLVASTLTNAEIAQAQATSDAAALSSSPTGAEGGQQQQAQAVLDPLLPELAQQKDEVLVQFGLLVGADGADSPVRDALSKKKPKITDFDVQRPMRDTRQYKTFSGLPQCSTSSNSAQVIPNLAQHQPREYEYVYQAQDDSSGKLAAPKLRLWVSEEGLVSGTITQEQEGSWDSQVVERALQGAYGDNLPAEWRQGIVAQTCGAASPASRTKPSTVQMSQFHGPQTVLLGDAAHAMTGEYDQGINCAVESVRLLNIALKTTRDNLEKGLPLYSEVRGEDVHSMQQLEFFQRSCQAGLTYADMVHRFAGLVGVFVWKLAMTTMKLARHYYPDRFPTTYVTDRIWDARKGYSDLLKVVVRFAGAPVVATLACVVLLAKFVFMPGGLAA